MKNPQNFECKMRKDRESAFFLIGKSTFLRFRLRIRHPKEKIHCRLRVFNGLRNWVVGPVGIEPTTHRL